MSNIKIKKLNIFDIVVIIVILLCVVFLMVKIFSNSRIKNEDMSLNTFSYTMKIEGISDTSEEMVKVGDKVYDKLSNTCIGEIINIDVTRALTDFEDMDGTIKKVEKPTKIDMSIVVRANGSIKNGEYLANNLIRILVGQNKEIKTKYWMATVLISDIY